MTLSAADKAAARALRVSALMESGGVRFEGACWGDPHTTFYLSRIPTTQAEAGAVIGKGFNRNGDFTVKGLWHTERAVELTVTNSAGGWLMKLRWDASQRALVGSAQANAGEVRFNQMDA